MANKLFNSVVNYIKNKTFNIVKVINSNNNFSGDNVNVSVLPVNCYLENDPQFLSVFSQVGTTCQATDTAILTGATVLDKNLKKYARVLTSSNAQNKSVYDIGFDGEDQIDKVTSKNKCIRPALVFNSLAEIPPTAVKDYNDVVRFTLGEYPQTAVSEKLQDKLNYYAYNPNYVSEKDSFFKTGKSYSFYCKNGSSEDVSLKQCAEYSLNGEKFVKIPSSLFNYYLSLSNGQMITAERQEDVWVKVEPVTFLLSQKPDNSGKYVAVSEKALVSGVPFDAVSTNYSTSNLKLFTELRLLPEMLLNATPKQSYELGAGYYILNNGAFSHLNSLTHVTLPHTLSKIDYNAFQNSSVKQISYKTANGTVLNAVIPENQKIECVGAYGGGIIVYSKGNQLTNTTLTYLRKDGSYATINGVNSQKIMRLALDNNLDLVFNWENSKQNLSNGIKRRAVPNGYVLEGLGTEPEIIKKYHETASTGLSVLEDKPWFKTKFHSDQVQLVRLFATMGGLEPDVNHQARVINLLEQMNNYYDADFSRVLGKLNLPSGLSHTNQNIIEYKHNKDNKVVMQNGIAQIKRTKQATFHKQIFNFVSEYFNHPNFEDVAGTLATKYYDVYNFYKHKLELSNPSRHPGVKPETYFRTMANGISPELVQDYMFNCRYHTENAELQQTLSRIKSQYNLSAEVVSRYDKLITDAKVLEAKSQVLNKVTAEPVRLKYFMDSVDDVQSNSNFSFVWPPLSSATAITIGQRLGTCFRVNGKNESALINYITDKRDGLMLLFDSNNEPCGYCRVNYDVNNKGILIDTIDLTDELALNREVHPQIWETFERGVFAMANAMNADGKYPVERISCKPDPYNKVLNVVQQKYMPASKLKAKVLEERFYSTKQDIPHQKYYSQYLATEEQLVISSPELTKFNLSQAQTLKEGAK